MIGLEITGNHYFDKELLSSRLQIYKAAFGSRGKFSRRLIEADRQSMENLYRANGFPAATVAAQILDNYEEKQGVFIRFVVSEDVQTRVADLRIEGNQAFGKQELLGVIASLPGQPYSDFNVATDRANILAQYFNEGFPEATFESEVQPVEEQATPAKDNSTEGKLQDRSSETRAEKKTGPVAAKTVRLIYRIHEGPQIHVHRVLITGLKRTRLGVVKREVGVRPAQPLREGQVVDSQRRLYNLGVFNRVTISPQNPTGTDTEKDVVETLHHRIRRRI